MGSAKAEESLQHCHAVMLQTVNVCSSYMSFAVCMNIATTNVPSVSVSAFFCAWKQTRCTFSKAWQRFHVLLRTLNPPAALYRALLLTGKLYSATAVQCLCSYCSIWSVNDSLAHFHPRKVADSTHGLAKPQQLQALLMHVWCTCHKSNQNTCLVCCCKHACQTCGVHWCRQAAQC